MAIENIPYEIKVLVYDALDDDLGSIKSLRQTSKAWGSAGLALLLLPSFHVTSSRDLKRLISIGRSPTMSEHARRIIRSLEFQAHGHDLCEMRKIVCDRHVSRQQWETVAFVPTQEEQFALDELDAFIKQTTPESQGDGGEYLLDEALRFVPGVQQISFVGRNPFKHRILRKCWDEWNLHFYSNKTAQTKQVNHDVLGAAFRSCLDIQHLSHDFAITCLCSADMPFTKSIQGLKIAFHGFKLNFNGQEDDRNSRELRNALCLFPSLKSLNLTFHLGGTTTGHFLPHPLTFTANLQALYLGGFLVTRERSLTFFSYQIPSLKRLSLSDVCLAQGEGAWKEFLQELRALPGQNLSQFQLCGSVRNTDDGRSHWYLWPIYDERWEVKKTPDFWKRRVTSKQATMGMKTKLIEDYVLRDGPWPMHDGDDVLGD